MTTGYDNTNRGVLFNERDKKVKDEDRDYNGTLNVEGTEYWLSGWIKTSKKDGRKFLSLSVKPKQNRAADKSESRQVQFNDAVPFAPEVR